MPLGKAQVAQQSGLYLGDEPLDEVGISADHINAVFGASRYFTDSDARRLIYERELPRSARPHADASAELLELVDDLWKSVEQIYHQKWGRPLADIERRIIGDFAVAVLRGKPESDASLAIRPPVHY